MLFAVIQLLDLPALACFAQTCKDTRAACLTDAVWDKYCDSKRPTLGSHPHKYHRPRPGHSTDIRQPTPQTDTTDRDSPLQDATAPALQYHIVDSCTQPQVRYAYYDYNMRLKYESGVVLDPAWLSLLPKVSSQGSSWLYAKAKSLSGVLRATHHSCTLSSTNSCYMPAEMLCNFHHTLTSTELH